MMIIVNNTTYVRSVYFSPPVLVSLQEKFEVMKLKDLKQQTSCNSVTAQAGLFFIRQTLPSHGSRPTPKSHPSNPFWFCPFYTSHLLLWLYPMQNRACTLYQSRKRMQIGICSRPTHNCMLCNNSLCYVCLPIIQSVIIRCLYV